MTNFKSPDVMRFLGRKLVGQYRGEVTTHFKLRVEGTRIKHAAKGNSIKMYNKQGNVLRVEQTTTDPNEFKVVRRAHGDPRASAARDRYARASSTSSGSPPLAKPATPATSMRSRPSSSRLRYRASSIP
jgi:hypothetical protein